MLFVDIVCKAMRIEKFAVYPHGRHVSVFLIVARELLFFTSRRISAASQRLTSSFLVFTASKKAPIRTLAFSAVSSYHNADKLAHVPSPIIQCLALVARIFHCYEPCRYWHSVAARQALRGKYFSHNRRFYIAVSLIAKPWIFLMPFFVCYTATPSHFTTSNVFLLNLCSSIRYSEPFCNGVLYSGFKPFTFRFFLPLSVVLL